MKKSTSEFLETWQKRYTNINGNDLNSLFSRFTTLYTIYNRLYREAFEKLKASGVIVKSRNSDIAKATEYVVNFLSGDTILDWIGKDLLSDIETISMMIGEAYNINLNDEGEAQLEFDNQLIENLNHQDSYTKARAILMLIYQVRCNMEHAYKNFEPHQRFLVETLTKLLEKIVELLIKKLS